jgi:glycyl-tRNA synthetase beta chain
MSAQLLLEIGTEEIPARFMESTLEELKIKARSILENNHIAYGDICVMGTPRRLVLEVTGLADRQDDIPVERTGPSVQVAFDDKGNPTKAALGFARSCGVSVDDLERKHTEKGEYIAVKIVKKGRDTVELLVMLLPEIMSSLSFPKSMRWESSGITFARPVRWILSLLDGKTIAFDYAGIRSAHVTHGHRTLAPGPYEIEDASRYRDVMKKARVFVDHRQRKDTIARQINALADTNGAIANIDDDLLEEVTHLVEYPTALAGEFSKKYLILPQEVLITAISGQQKYFPLFDGQGKIIPNFVNIINADPEQIDTIRAGNEKVLKARLEDAKYFFEEDLKVPVESQVEALRGVLFIKEAGTMFEKMERMRRWTDDLCRTMKLNGEDRQLSLRAARLAKFDLVSLMVQEKDFSKLQGIMGHRYALHHGENSLVARAIEEHYLPRFSGDRLPETKQGIIVSLSDRLDTITACFSLGLDPTGSQDPFALRRNAIGVLRILMEKDISIDLYRILSKGIDLFPEKLSGNRQDVLVRIDGFFRDRLRTIFEEQNTEFDIIESACLSEHYTTGTNRSLDPAVLKSRIRILASERNDPMFGRLVTGSRRVFNILKNISEEELGGVSPDKTLFTDSAENALFEKVENTGTSFQKLADSEMHRESLMLLFELAEPVDAFFDRVLVMAEDEKLKMNRLRLLASVRQLLLRFADFSRISTGS